jgi:hypothetical protein
MQTSAEYQCPRHATVTYMTVNVVACGRHPSSGCQMPTFEGHRYRPAARTFALTREKLAGMRGGYVMERRIAKSNQPDRNTEIHVHGHG